MIRQQIRLSTTFSFNLGYIFYICFNNCCENKYFTFQPLCCVYCWIKSGNVIKNPYIPTIFLANQMLSFKSYRKLLFLYKKDSYLWYYFKENLLFQTLIWLRSIQKKSMWSFSKVSQKKLVWVILFKPFSLSLWILKSEVL